MFFDICLLTFDMLIIDYRYVMNNPPKIIKGIRAAFVGFRWLFLVSIVAVIIQFVVGPKTLTATLGLAPETPALAGLQTGDSAVHVDGLKADVTLAVGDNGELRRVAFVSVLPGMLIIACAGLVLCEMVQRLARNLETGELFSDRNLNFLRGIGLVLVISAVLENLVTSVGRHVFGQYAAAHLSVPGAKILPIVDHLGIKELSIQTGGWAVFVLGLLFLLLIQACREGLKLKQETDLTV